MYSIEEAKDVEPIREWAIEFLATLGEDLSPDHFVAQWRKFFESGIGKIFYLINRGHVVGGIGAIEAPSLTSGKIELIEVFWYVTPQHRRAGTSLYAAMDKYFSNSPHISRFAMIHMENSMPDKLKMFYTRQGFRLLETHWVKEK